MYNDVCRMMENMACSEAKMPQIETVHDLLNNISGVISDIRGTTQFINSSLFGNDGPPIDKVNKKEIACTRDHVCDIYDELTDIYNVLAFVRDRL